MGKGNGKSEATNLDLEHELPAGDGGEETSASGAGATVDISAASELDKLKAEIAALKRRIQ